MPKGQPGTFTHGLSGYSKGCKCPLCKQAARDYYENVVRPRKGCKPMAEHLAAIRPPHGTEGRYVNHKCRCDACRVASAAARRRRRAALAS